jgi:cell division protein FtsQ
MSAIRPLDDGPVSLGKDMPKIRVRPDDADLLELDEPQDAFQVDDDQWLANEEPDTDEYDENSRTALPRSAGHILATVLIMIGLTAGGIYLLQPDTLPIRQVQIEGEFRQLSQRELQAIVLEHLRGGFFSVNVVAVRDAVRAEPWVREVWVQRVWPDALQVSVREQVAVARWGETGFISSDGDYFEPSGARLPDNSLPLLIGPEGAQAQMAAKLDLAQELLVSLGLHVVRLEVSDRRAWSFTTATGLEVVLGRDDFERRLRRFVDLVPRSLGERLDEAAYVDMRYTNGFAVRFNETGGAPAGREGAA